MLITYDRQNGIVSDFNMSKKNSTMKEEEEKYQLLIICGRLFARAPSSLKMDLAFSI
jgi:hypothetical protein